MPAIIKIKRGKKRGKGARERGVAEMLKNSGGRPRFYEPKMLPPSVRVVIPAGVSYQEARFRFMAYLCPRCQDHLQEGDFCPKCQRSWTGDDLQDFPKR